MCAWVLGFGAGLPGGYGIWHFAYRGDVWMFMGFPTYGDGPFERIGLTTSIPLLTAFLLVCLGEIIMGYLLWQRRRAGRLPALALLPVGLAFWTGFALPFGFLLGAARSGLVLVRGPDGGAAAR